MLKQSLELYDFYTQQVEACDKEIASEVFQKESCEARLPTRPTSLLILKSWDEKRRPQLKMPCLRLMVCKNITEFF